MKLLNQQEDTSAWISVSVYPVDRIGKALITSNVAIEPETRFRKQCLFFSSIARSSFCLFIIADISAVHEE